MPSPYVPDNRATIVYAFFHKQVALAAPGKIAMLAQGKESKELYGRDVGALQIKTSCAPFVAKATPIRVVKLVVKLVVTSVVLESCTLESYEGRVLSTSIVVLREDILAVITPLIVGAMVAVACSV